MSRGTPTPAIDVAIINWNTAEAAVAAARAYLASTEVTVQVTIADNASSPNQRRFLKEECPPGVNLALNDRNLGFGTAANQALRGSTGNLVCVSNADVLPQPEALAELAASALSEPKVGMVGPMFGTDTNRYHAALPNAPTMLARIFLGSFGESPQPRPMPGQTQEVGQPSGACFVVQRELWEQVGGFDEGFFLWYEDVDLAKRLHDAGNRNLVVGSALVDHVGAESFVQLDRQTQQAIRLNSVERYIRKHHPRAAPFSRPILRASRRLRAGRGASSSASASA